MAEVGSLLADGDLAGDTPLCCTQGKPLQKTAGQMPGCYYDSANIAVALRHGRRVGLLALLAGSACQCPQGGPGGCIPTIQRIDNKKQFFQPKQGCTAMADKNGGSNNGLDAACGTGGFGASVAAVVGLNQKPCGRGNMPRPALAAESNRMICAERRKAHQSRTMRLVPRHILWLFTALFAFSGIASGIVVPQEGDLMAKVIFTAGGPAGPYAGPFSSVEEMLQARMVTAIAAYPSYTVNFVYLVVPPSPYPIKKINGIPFPGHVYANITSIFPPYSTNGVMYAGVGINSACPSGYTKVFGNTSPYISTTDTKINGAEWHFCRPNATTNPPPQDPPGPPGTCPVGNPIDMTNGIKIQRETDYKGADVLEFTRTYRSSTGQFQSLLTSNYLAADVPGNPKGSSGVYYYLTVTFGGTSFSARFPVMTGNLSAANHHLYAPDGQRYQFTEDASGNPVAKADTNITVSKNPDTATQSVWLWELTRADDSHEQYNAQGKIVAQWQRQGTALKTTYSYSDAATPSATAPWPGLLTQITNGFGRSLTFYYNASAQLVKMTAPDGDYTYAYNDAAASDNLTSVTYPDGNTRTYVYNEPAYLPAISATVPNPLYPHALTGIFDENGVRFATYIYDTSGKAVSTEHATGGIDKYALNYAPDGTSTAVTDPLGSVRTTHFTTVLGIVKPTGTDQPGGSGCSAASSHTEYDANGNVASRTDFNGHKTCYAYDLSRNLETARVEGLASVTDCATVLGAGATLPANTRKTSTAWHPSYRLPVTVAEPKRLTTTSYDANGNVLTRSEQATTDANGASGLSPVVGGPVRTWAYTYNSLGQMLTADGPRPVADAADKTTYTYYPTNDPVLGNRGNLKDRTNALGHKTTFNTYNANGQPTRITAANGTVTDLEYFPRGWLKTLTVTAGGNSPPPPEVTRYTYDATGLLKTVTLPDTSTLTYSYDAAHRLTDIEDSFTLGTAPPDSHNKVHYDLDNSGNRIKETYTDPTGTLKSNITRSYDALGRLQTLTTGGGQ